MTDQTTTAPVRLPLSRRINLPVVTAFGCIVLLLAVGSLYSPNFLSPEYLLLQLKVGAFLGIIATGIHIVFAGLELWAYLRPDFRAPRVA